MVQPERSREIHVTLTLLYKFKFFFCSSTSGLDFILHSFICSLPGTLLRMQNKFTILCKVGSLKQIKYTWIPLYLLHFNYLAFLLVHPADCSQVTNFASVGTQFLITKFLIKFLTHKVPNNKCLITKIPTHKKFLITKFLTIKKFLIINNSHWSL